MKTMTIQFRGLCAVLVFVLAAPLTVVAHSTNTNEQASGNHKATLSFFGDSAFVGEIIRFDLLLYTAAGDAIAFTEADVKVENAAGAVVSEARTSRPEGYLEDASELQYEFPESGNYKLTFDFKRGGSSVAQITFPMYVYADPDAPEPNAASNTPVTAATSNPGIPETKPLISAAVIVVLSLGGGAYYFLRRRNT